MRLHTFPAWVLLRAVCWKGSFFVLWRGCRENTQKQWKPCLASIQTSVFSSGKWGVWLPGSLWSFPALTGCNSADLRTEGVRHWTQIQTKCYGLSHTVCKQSLSCSMGDVRSSVLPWLSAARHENGLWDVWLNGKRTCYKTDRLDSIDTKPTRWCYAPDDATHQVCFLRSEVVDFIFSPGTLTKPLNFIQYMHVYVNLYALISINLYLIALHISFCILSAPAFSPLLFPPSVSPRPFLPIAQKPLFYNGHQLLLW